MNESFIYFSQFRPKAPFLLFPRSSRWPRLLWGGALKLPLYSHFVYFYGHLVPAPPLKLKAFSKALKKANKALKGAIKALRKAALKRAIKALRKASLRTRFNHHVIYIIS